ncbi:MAG: SPOR domain-containing protein [Candidatus Omnitrophica bacterium]|nr:SPOR domain-containing protein [Candidatus Omnitrophota bacterium]
MTRRSVVMYMVAGSFFISPEFCAAGGFPASLDTATQALLQGNAAQAAEECDRLERSMPAALLGDIALLRGHCLYEQEDYTEARASYKQALRHLKGAASVPAYLGVADTYIQQGKIDYAFSIYEQLLRSNDAVDYRARVLSRLNISCRKMNDAARARVFLQQLQDNYPQSWEAQRAGQDVPALSGFFTVQVGCFLNVNNAQQLADSLKQKGYDVYLEQMDANGRRQHRVRIGHLSTRTDAEMLERELREKENLPTRIFP